MSEKIFTFCDKCNPNMIMNDSGRGYVEGGHQFVIVNFDWQMRKGVGLICTDCIEEEPK